MIKQNFFPTYRKMETLQEVELMSLCSDLYRRYISPPKDVDAVELIENTLNILLRRMIKGLDTEYMEYFLEIAECAQNAGYMLSVYDGNEIVHSFTVGVTYIVHCMPATILSRMVSLFSIQADYIAHGDIDDVLCKLLPGGASTEWIRKTYNLPVPMKLKMGIGLCVAYNTESNDIYAQCLAQLLVIAEKSKFTITVSEKFAASQLKTRCELVAEEVFDVDEMVDSYGRYFEILYDASEVAKDSIMSVFSSSMDKLYNEGGINRVLDAIIDSVENLPIKSLINDGLKDSIATMYLRKEGIF